MVGRGSGLVHVLLLLFSQSLNLELLAFLHDECMQSEKERDRDREKHLVVTV